MTKKELSQAYGLSAKTINRRLKMIEIDTAKRRLSPKELALFIDEYGDPEVYRKNEHKIQALLITNQ